MHLADSLSTYGLNFVEVIIKPERLRLNWRLRVLNLANHNPVRIALLPFSLHCRLLIAVTPDSHCWP